MPSYLVTGGCGFIGSHLCDELLKRGDKVIVLDNLAFGKRENISSDVELIVGDIRDIALVNEIMHRVDGCFHLAAITSVELCNQNWVDSHQVNLTGTIIIFNAAVHAKKEKPIPVVYASSCAVYGGNKKMPLSEVCRPHPLTTYAADKLGAELHARAGAIVHNLATTGLRLFNVYGPRQDPHNAYSGVISIFVDHLLHNDSIMIHGNGQQTRDFVYIADAVRFLITSMERLLQQKKPNNFIYNVCTGNSISINELALLIGEILGKPQIKIFHDKVRKGDVINSLGDPEKSWRDLQIKTHYNLSQGLQEYLRFLHD